MSGNSKGNVVTVRMSEEELRMVDYLSKSMGKSRSDVLRTCLWVVRILYSEKITLADALKSIPVLADKLRVKGEDIDVK